MSIDVIKLAREAGASESAVTKALCFRPDELSRFAASHRALVLEEAARQVRDINCTNHDEPEQFFSDFLLELRPDTPPVQE